MATKKKKRTAAQNGARSRRKGAVYELAAASMLREAFPKARRGIGQARSGGDVPDVEGCEPFWFQMKCGKSENLRAALQQAIDELTRYVARDPRSRYSIPIVMARRDRCEDVVLLRVFDFVKLACVLNDSQSLITELKTQLESSKRAMYELTEPSKEGAGNGA